VGVVVAEGKVVHISNVMDLDFLDRVVELVLMLLQIRAVVAAELGMAVEIKMEQAV
jgi:hypothetical protein